MNKARIDLFSKLTEDSKMALTYQDFTISEIIEIISETPLTSIDREIALMRYTQCMTFEDIAEKLGYDTRTIRNRIPKLSLSLKKTCAKLFTKEK